MLYLADILVGIEMFSGWLFLIKRSLECLKYNVFLPLTIICTLILILDYIFRKSLTYCHVLLDRNLILDDYDLHTLWSLHAIY